MLRRSLLRGLAVLTLLTSAATTVQAQGRIFVNHDEWTLSGTGIAQAGGANVTQFTRNVASWLTGGLSGSVLIASGNFGFPPASVATDLSTGGYSFTVTQNNTAGGWAGLSGYNAVFVDASSAGAGSNAQLQADLQAYVLGGGSVFVNFGTGLGGPAAEAAAFNTFLGYFGIQAAPQYNGISGVTNTTTFAGQGPYGAGLFTGVSGLYSNNGNTLSQGGSNGAGYTTQFFGNGQYAAASATNVVPEPSTWALMVAGLAGLGIAARRRRRI
ncbi:MAG: PEP-CTERM sorting domain-containing protein [Gemmatimonadetes bacterium]|nr:PEP-CTERM sorting domain-containing protein [Gemmatimonadota bacterium]